ncbi:restriction endonuclease subunit S [uncultured Agrobacterium sp.]|uniref:restriction endonuclease subunit S n=1 Tax=uncultured Agrobacterium sp. TaxID=157277 RepID=UPI0025E57008|nr:restriction endonuclease subunit S [uncultured Agrobacterium sp.]
MKSHTTSKRERYTAIDIGPTPADWSDPVLQKVAPFISNGFVGTATPHYAAQDDHGAVKYLYGTNIRKNEIVPAGLRYITAKFHEQQEKTKLRLGDVLTVQSGHIGTTAVVTEDYDGSNCHALIISRLDQSLMCPWFLSQYLNSNIGKARLRGLEVGSTILHINTKDLKNFRVPCPPLLEQKKIVQILSTWDEAIKTTEKLLGNTKAQKRALMQQLLTGKTRLKGFEGSQWARRPLDTVFERVRRKNTVANKNVLTISGREGLVSQSQYFNKVVAAADTSGYTLLQGGEFAYNKSYSAGYPLGAIKMLPLEVTGVLSSLYICFRVVNKGRDHPDFYRHWFEFGGLDRELSVIAQEGARNHGLLNVGVSEFFKLLVSRPSADEQRKIAAVLNDAETQVNNVELQLGRLKSEKRALMQQLLTGKRRVTV